MAKKQTESSSFRSNYTDGWITPAQRLAELMCERLARKDGATLPWKFWDSPQWKKIFLTQLRFANGLLRAYPFQAVFAVLESRQGLRAYSLGAKWLDEAYSEEAAKLKKFQATIEPQETTIADEDISMGEPVARNPETRTKASPSILSRLQEME